MKNVFNWKRLFKAIYLGVAEGAIVLFFCIMAFSPVICMWFTEKVQFILIYPLVGLIALIVDKYKKSV